MAAIAFLPFQFVDIPQVACAFTSRRGGASEPPHDSANISFDVGDDPKAVTINRQAVHERMQLTGWCELNQVHGDIIHFDPAPHPPEEHASLDGDGMATATPGHGLVIKTADCQPILLAHRSGKYVAGLHAGWRGNRCNFPGSGVRNFCTHYNLKPEDVFAVRGPSLSPAAAQFVNFDKDFGPGFRAYFDSTTKTVDLWRLTRDQLMNAGVPEKQIFGMNLCTMGMDDTFFSYRKACASPIKDTGRQCGIIWIRK
ncbi:MULTISPECIES: polyphenol oxidase family protein [unclassified Pseudodesulfovibrio]|uniref:polyphenol oxidase family protein n=1 Tax=unclassified Pseudodesulfovibrio TaxID=2661612 RepID=UPI000FEB893F|nr:MULTISPECIES: polyphenol oxidase family protein [unclassified Pseudodesulfovibrio]MCJ2165719.1 polyphenol oxidase family protein [Pseudodesulfovibrio sp. S3-i]RWU02909.1 laccase domain-containing protein [Pseudodesulfovibrio sp. S3]